MITQKEGVPNITGDLNFLGGQGNYEANPLWSTHGAFTRDRVGTYGACIPQTFAEATITSAYFNAGNSSKIYGSSEHVTPSNTSMKIWKRIS